MSEPVLIRVEINPESRVKVVRVAKPGSLRSGVWHRFSVEIVNEARSRAVLRVVSPNAPAVPGDRERWLDLSLDAERGLSGVLKERRTLSLRSRDAGWREATLAFDVGQGTQDLGFRGEVAILFRFLEAK